MRLNSPSLPVLASKITENSTPTPSAMIGLPINKKKLVEAWIEIHKEDLQANWKLLDEGEPFFKIEPLK